MRGGRGVYQVEGSWVLFVHCLLIRGKVCLPVIISRKCAVLVVAKCSQFCQEHGSIGTGKLQSNECQYVWNV